VLAEGGFDGEVLGLDVSAGAVFDGVVLDGVVLAGVDCAHAATAKASANPANAAALYDIRTVFIPSPPA
jgi:hypothetical protein